MCTYMLTCRSLSTNGRRTDRGRASIHLFCQHNPWSGVSIDDPLGVFWNKICSRETYYKSLSHQHHYHHADSGSGGGMSNGRSVLGGVVRTVKGRRRCNGRRPGEDTLSAGESSPSSCSRGTIDASHKNNNYHQSSSDGIAHDMSSRIGTDLVVGIVTIGHSS